MEEETPAQFIVGWTPRGLATASATAVLGPRPDSSTSWREAFTIGSTPTTLRGDFRTPHRLALAVAVVPHTHSPHKHPLPPLGLEYPGAATQHPLRLELGAPAAAWASSNGPAGEGDENTWRCVPRRRGLNFCDLIAIFDQFN